MRLGRYDRLSGMAFMFSQAGLAFVKSAMYVRSDLKHFITQLATVERFIHKKTYSS